MTEKLQSILEAEQFSHLFERFEASGITDAIMANLSDSDLREIGIDKLGERMRLLLAFEKLSNFEVTIACSRSDSVEVVKKMRDTVVVGLADAKRHAEENVPLKNLTWDEASLLKSALEPVGASVEIRRCLG